MTDLSTLNEQQKDAVLKSINKNVVLFAGAGAGKTTCLVKRTQYLIDDLGVSPQNIMLITFTNKAANEIRERISKISPEAHKMWIGTFHRICTRLIRMFGHKLGIQNFTIMDTKDSRNLIKEILESKGVDYDSYKVNDIANKISSYKNNLINPAKVLANKKVKRLIAEVYQEYQNISWRRKSFDFDDLIIYAVLLLSSYPEVSNWVHENIKYVMLDESQDTCSSQFQLIKLIAGNNNIMMVGDTCQSIYGFRNAKPQYLESFANTHPNTIKLKLEQNYRSTKTIIEAANNVVNKNKFGTKLKMFCSNTKGEKIQVFEALNSYDEIKWIATEILANGKKDLSKYAIIYRANYQSRIIEEEFTKYGIGYTIFGSQSFYTRKEVRDLLAYCKLVVNPFDVESFKRILGTLKGVGKVTIDNIINYAQLNLINYHGAINAYLPQIKNSMVYHRLETVSKILNTKYNKCSDIVSDVLFLTDYKRDLLAIQTEETLEKLDIIDEFEDMVKSMESLAKDETMAEIIDQIALLSETKGAEKEQLNAVKLMTAHASKGLEFETVFIIGAEEGTFPHANAFMEKNKEEAIEEERRLFYVAMTRAKKKLYITRSCEKKNSKDGGITFLKPSRFLREIPKSLQEDAF